MFRRIKKSLLSKFKFINFIQFKKSWLTYLIKLELKKIYKKNFSNFVKNILNELYIPSKTSILTIIVVMSLFYIVSHFINFRIMLSQSQNQFQNLISIHAGIGIIIFALIIFIAESFREIEGKDRGLVLLKVSYLFPLATVEVLAFFIFIWGGVNYWAILIVILIGLFTIFALARIVNTLLSRHKFRIVRENLYIDRIQMSINLAIKERIGKNILLKKIDNKEIKLNYYIFSIENKSEYHNFKTEKRGIIADINLERLKEFSNLVEEEANKNNFVFDEIDKKKLFKKDEDSKELIVNNKRHLLKMFHDQINDENNILICIDKSLISDNAILHRLNSIFNGIFIIKKSDSFTIEVRDELSDIYDQFISAISNKQLRKIEELINLYIKISESFSRYMQSHGIAISFEQALNESSFLFNGWKEIRWLFTDIRSIFNIAMRSREKEIIFKVGYLPIAISNRAIDYNDHYLFQEFIIFNELLYLSAFGIEDEDPQLSDLMKDRSFRYLKEVSDYKLEPKIRRDDLKENEIISIKDFVVYLFVIFQRLLKISYDKEDNLDIFAKFKKSVLKIFEDFHPSTSLKNADHYKWQLKIPELSEDEEKSIENKLQRQILLEKIEEEINYRKMQMLYGLASWLLMDSLEKKEASIKYFEIIKESIPTEIIELTRVFLNSIKAKDERLWGWTLWEITEEDKVQSIDFGKKLINFYCVKLLESISSITNSEISKLKLPTEYNNETLPTEGIIESLKRIEENIDYWRSVLTEEEVLKITSLLNLLENTKEKIKEEENKKLRESKISKDKIDTFKNEFKEGFYEHSFIRDIFIELRRYRENLGKINENIQQFGFKRLDEKAVFLENWNISYLDWGITYGRWLALDENTEIIRNIEESSIKIEEANIEDVLSNFKKISNIWILTTSEELHKSFIYSKRFKPKWYKDIDKMNLKNFEGYYSFNGYNIPVFSIYLNDERQNTIIIDKNRIGNFTQFSPINNSDEKKLIFDIFIIDIESFSENNDLLNEFLVKNADILIKKRSIEAQKNYLKEKVLISIFEKFEYKADNFKGYLIKKIYI